MIHIKMTKASKLNFNLYESKTQFLVKKNMHMIPF